MIHKKHTKRPLNKYLIVSTAFILCILAPSLNAQSTNIQIGNPKKPLQTITLNDGTVIKGRLKSIRNGFYIIKTKSMGEVKIHVSDLNSITNNKDRAQQLPQFNNSINNNSNPPLHQQQSLTSNLNNLQTQLPFGQNSNQLNMLSQQLLSDPQINASVKELLQDPEIMQLLSDPQVMQDIYSMNPNQIQNNSNVKKLLEHPKMKEIINQTGGKFNMQTMPICPRQ